jgi:transposase-like protein
MDELALEARDEKDWRVTREHQMPGLTSCPFCQSSRIRARLPIHDLHEYECEACTRTWLVARPRRQAKIVDFPTARVRARRKTGTAKA